MEIQITKRAGRNILTCKRADGTFTSEALGPDFPNHDIAHFVVETHFKLEGGFYGKIKSGMSIQELSDKEVIRRLGAEAWLSEVLSRNLQVLGAGGCSISEYIELVNWEAGIMQNIRIPEISAEEVEKMKTHFDELCKRWDELKEDEKLVLEF
ncbi:MAG TPA: hypothetical protein PKC40_07555 [Saprospiraceae bacterium]|nr:hypothetical protein [Saprospiraceae bacterium]